MKIATPEKALVDLFYLSGTRSRRWAARIAAPRLRTLVSERLERLLAKR
jgi:hypothetical protein